jgi:Flp pilus assembly protein TadB
VSAPLVGTFALVSAALFLGLALSLRDVARPALGLAHPDASALRDAGWREGLRRWEAIRAAVVVAAVCAALSLRAPLALALVAGIAPSMWIRIRAEDARARARRAFGRILAATEAAVRSGISLPEALRRGSDAAADPLASRPIADALRAFDLGSSMDAALGTAVERYRSDPRAREAVATLQLGIAERLPRERMADLLGVLVDRCTFEERLEDEVDARAAGARQQQWLLAAIVPGLAVYLALTIPSLAGTLGSDLGRYVLVPAAAALEIAGIVLSRRVIRGAVP